MTTRNASDLPIHGSSCVQSYQSLDSDSLPILDFLQSLCFTVACTWALARRMIVVSIPFAVSRLPFTVYCQGRYINAAEYNKSSTHSILPSLVHSSHSHCVLPCPKRSLLLVHWLFPHSLAPNRDMLPFTSVSFPPLSYTLSTSLTLPQYAKPRAALTREDFDCRCPY